MENTPVRGYKRLIIVLFITLASLICGSQAVFAESSLTLALSSSQINLNPSNQDLNSAVQAINVSTTSSVGYIVNFATSGSTTSLVNKNDSSKTIPTFTLPSGSSSIPASSVGYGYGYSIDNGVNYRPVPNPSGNSDTIFETFSAGTNSHVLTYGAKVSGLDIAGSYDNTFTIFAIAKLEPCPVDKICYYGNGDDGTGNMSDQSTSSNTDVMLMASNFSRPGYGFVGWNTEADGSGTNLGPSQTITTGDLSTTGLQLYAKWVPSSGNLQNWQSCGSMSRGDVIGLTDSRDNSTYAVAKYDDDKCWMMENLRLDLSNQNVEINTLNTNGPTSDFVTAINNNRPVSNNQFCTNEDQSCTDQININTNNTNRSLTASYNASNDSSSWYSYGNYYNWYTATAGNGTYSFNATGTSVSGDLCPAGWRLPTGNNAQDDLAVLDEAMGGTGANAQSGSAGTAASARWRAYPLNYLYSGEQRGNNGYNRNVSSNYATANTSSGARNMNLWIRAAGVNLTSNNNPKHRGHTIRCLATESYSAIGNIHYDSNGGTGTMADEEDVNLSSAVAANNNFTRNHYEFISWNTKADGTGVAVAEGYSVINAAKNMGITEGGTLTLYATWRPLYTVSYDGNGADTGVMSMVIYDLGSSIRLYSPNFLRSGYGFIGWSTDPDAATKLANGQQVTIYGPNDSVYTDSVLSQADANNRITFYAVWIAADNHTLQAFSNTECSNLSIGDVLALTDSRDNQTYAIAKLGDNHCWMIENLRLDPSQVIFSNANTNSPTTAFINNAPQSSTSNNFCATNDSLCVDQILFNTNNLNSSLTPSHNEADNYYRYWYSYGIYYNWHTATAGNGNFAMTSGNASGDICPAGWRLPTGGSGGDFDNLNAIINSSSVLDALLKKYPNNFIYSGDFNQSSTGGRNLYGRLWSSTPNGGNESYRFGFAYDNVTTVRSYNKWVGFPVRCIAK